MQITRFAEARRYDAPKHFDMRSLRLQGFDMSASQFAWVGLSQFLPQGGAEMDAGALEKIYVVLEGEVTVQLADGTRHVLKALDSCHIPGGEARAIRNEANTVATMLVVGHNPGFCELADALAGAGEAGGKIDTGRSLADPALLVGDSEDAGRH